MKAILVTASTNSDWDSCDFAVLTLSDKFVSYLKDLHNDLLEIHKRREDPFIQLKFFGDNTEFFIEGIEPIPWIPEGFMDNPMQEPILIDVPDNYQDDALTPENSLRGGYIKIMENTFQAVTYGQHTGDEFWTDEIPFELLD